MSFQKLLFSHYTMDTVQRQNTTKHLPYTKAAQKVLQHFLYFSQNGHKKQAIRNIRKAEYNKQVDGVQNFLCTKITEELGTPERKINDKMLGQSEQMRMW
jgi:hypothetical protein